MSAALCMDERCCERARPSGVGDDEEEDEEEEKEEEEKEEEGKATR